MVFQTWNCFYLQGKDTGQLCYQVSSQNSFNVPKPKYGLNITFVQLSGTQTVRYMPGTGTKHFRTRLLISASSPLWGGQPCCSTFGKPGRFLWKSSMVGGELETGCGGLLETQEEWKVAKRLRLGLGQGATAEVPGCVCVGSPFPFASIVAVLANGPQGDLGVLSATEVG